MRLSTRRVINYGAVAGALMLLALPSLVAQAANDDHAAADTSVAVDGVQAIGAASPVPISLQDAIDAVEPPQGFSRVSSQVYAIGDEEGLDNLTIAEAKFNGNDRSAVTVLIIDGGSWDLERELAVTGERSSAEVAVADHPAALIDGDASLSLAWDQPDGRIVQIVVRGHAISPDALLEYAEAVAGGQS